MGEILNSILDNSSVPVLTAFLLGLMTAISPCPLATNITAVGYIGKDVSNKRRVFYNGLIYTSGRAFAYTALALIIYIGADQFKISGLFQQYGERIIGPFLLLIGVLMLGIIKINLPGFSRLANRYKEKGITNSLDVFLLGVIFALAFCPYSGVLYFGMLIPLSVSSASGLFLPAVFALATGIPVIIFAWLIAYTVSGVGILYKKIKIFEFWFRRIIAILFIGVGIYYILTIYV